MKEIKGEMMIRCPFCPKEYQSYKDLKKHMLKIHECSVSKEDVEKFNRKFTLGNCVIINETE